MVVELFINVLYMVGSDAWFDKILCRRLYMGDIIYIQNDILNFNF